jgi:chromate transporter
VGINIAGIGGAIVATLGSITPSLFIVSLLAYIYRKYQDISVLKNVLACLRPAIVALIAGAFLSILNVAVWGGNAPSLAGTDWISAVSFVVVFFVLRRFKTSPILAMVASGVAGLVLNLIF